MSKMSQGSKKELTQKVQENYKKAGKKEKGKILDNYVGIAGYNRKYAIKLMSQVSYPDYQIKVKKKSQIKIKENEEIQEALKIIWKSANEICSKRLIGFIKEMVRKLEHLGYLEISDKVREKILNMSPSTIDRLLQKERKKKGGGISM